MKKLVLLAVMTILGMVAAFGQSTINVEGNVIKSVKAQTTHKADTLVTTYQYEDSKGNRYPIIINKNSGKCFIWKKSSKTGNMYKMYCNEETSRFVAKQVNIVYVESKKKEE